MYLHFSGNALQENAFAEMAKQTETFRSKLENFAHDHKNDIRKDPEFRRHFQGKLEFHATQPFLLHIFLNVVKMFHQIFFRQNKFENKIRETSDFYDCLIFSSEKLLIFIGFMK